MSEFNFEKLDVYNRSLDFIDSVYDITGSFPKDEIYSLTNQLRRASVSIALNIGEGAGGSDKKFNNYLRIASDSLKECVVCLTIAERRSYINEEQNVDLRNEIIVIAKMLTNLRKYLS